MKTYHVKCSETVNFTVAVEAETEDEARELAPVSYTHLTLPTTPYV